MALQQGFVTSGKNGAGLKMIARSGLCLLLSCCSFIIAFAQECPPNIDFENGTFSGWTCYTGHVASVDNVNVISISSSGGPVPDRHAMLTSFPGDGLDEFGGFPVNCPNGSGHSIKLGNTSGGNEAEGISYEFTVPANRNSYSLIYHYAVVFQDPNHLESEQPRMEVEVMNVTDNVRIDCSSFAFFPYGTGLPGFKMSDNPGSSTPVWYKDWTAVTVNLDNMAGKTFRLFFKTADCTFRRHFGYAYVDVNSECSSEFTGAAYCPDDTLVTVVAPYGYEAYNWFDTTFSRVLGNSQNLVLSPPPPVGTKIAVSLVPYNGYGCVDTLYARLVDTLTVYAHAGDDARSCNGSPVQLGLPPRPGIRYSWFPATGLSDATISNPTARPLSTTHYVLTASSPGGGCVSMDTVEVRADIIDTTLHLAGKSSFCITSEDSAVLQVQPTANIQWYRNNVPILSDGTNILHVRESGTYKAVLTIENGCSIASASANVFIDVPKKGIGYPVKFALANIPLPLTARPIGDTALWKPASYLNNAKSFSPAFKGVEDQWYTVDITTRAGCVTTDTQFVKIASSADIFVPTGFTPDGNGQNDILRPVLHGIRDFHYFRVYDRWGKLLFETKKEYEGWNGILNGHAEATQTVAWVVEGVGYDDKLVRKTGTTVLLR